MQWHKYDDSSVTLVNVDVVQAQNAYMLFYVKVPPGEAHAAAHAAVRAEAKLRTKLLTQFQAEQPTVEAEAGVETGGGGEQQGGGEQRGESDVLNGEELFAYSTSPVDTVTIVRSDLLRCEEGELLNEPGRDRSLLELKQHSILLPSSACGASM